MTDKSKSLVVGFGATELGRLWGGKPDVLISVEYDGANTDYNEDELLFYEILKKVGFKFDEAGRNFGGVRERYLVADNISFRWFKREFDRVIRERNGEDYYGFTDAKSAFMFGILSSENIRRLLFANLKDNWFWRVAKIMEKIK